MIKNNVSKVEITTENIKYHNNKVYICEVLSYYKHERE